MSPEDSSSELPAWKPGSRRLIARTRIFDLQAVEFRHPVRGTEREFMIVDAPDWVNVVALTPRRELVLVRQFRFGLNDFSLEIPGGVVDPGEDPVAAGVRELREETGFVGQSARVLGLVHPNPAFLSNRCSIVLVEQAERIQEPTWDHDEEIAVSCHPVESVFAMARDGRITHGIVLDALWLFESFWQEHHGDDRPAV